MGTFIFSNKANVLTLCCQILYKYNCAVNAAVNDDFKFHPPKKPLQICFIATIFHSYNLAWDESCSWPISATAKSDLSRCPFQADWFGFYPWHWVSGRGREGGTMMQDACKTPWSDARQTDSYPVTLSFSHMLRSMGEPNNNSQTTQMLIKLIGLKLHWKCD